MPDQVDLGDDRRAQKPHGLTVAAALQFVKDNFVVASAAALLIGVALATTFITAYLSVFDWHLIWFVQYADIITFGLLAAGIVSGSVTVLQGPVQAVLAGATREQRRSGLVIVLLLATAGLAFNVWGAVHRGEGFFHILSGFAVIGTGVVLIFVCASHVEANRLPTAVQCVFMLLLLVTGAGGLGRWLGESVDETSDFNQDVFLKDQTLDNVKLVIVMSRHTVLLKDGALYVVPTGDITKFRTVDRQAKPKFIPEE
jgi:hypothetical protein